MHSLLFILTHNGADVPSLKDAFTSVNPNMQVFSTCFQYQSYDDLQSLRKMPHSRKANSVWADTITDNSALSRFLLPHIDVMGYISATKNCELVLIKMFKDRAYDYYENRLMGIKQFIDRKKGVVISEPGDYSPRLMKLVKTYFPSL